MKFAAGWDLYAVLTIRLHALLQIIHECPAGLELNLLA